MPKRKWEPRSVKKLQTKVGNERFEQLLAEIGEVLYKQLRQQVQVQNASTEPALQELSDPQFKKAVSL